MNALTRKLKHYLDTSLPCCDCDQCRPRMGPKRAPGDPAKLERLFQQLWADVDKAIRVSKRQKWDEL